MPPPRLLATVLLAVAVGGCASNPAPVDVRGATLTLAVSEFAIRPQVVRVHSGPLLIVMHDAGILTHEVQVLGQPDDPHGPSFDYGGLCSSPPGATNSSTRSPIMRRWEPPERSSSPPESAEYAFRLRLCTAFSLETRRRANLW
jgi:hypothetical protein